MKTLVVLGEMKANNHLNNIQYLKKHMTDEPKNVDQKLLDAFLSCNFSDLINFYTTYKDIQLDLFLGARTALIQLVGTMNMEDGLSYKKEIRNLGDQELTHKLENRLQNIDQERLLKFKDEIYKLGIKDLFEKYEQFKSLAGSDNPFTRFMSEQIQERVSNLSGSELVEFNYLKASQLD